MEKHELIRMRRDTAKTLEFLKRAYCQELHKSFNHSSLLEHGIELTKTNLYDLNKQLGLSIFNEQTYIEGENNGARYN